MAEMRAPSLGKASMVGYSFRFVSDNLEDLITTPSKKSIMSIDSNTPHFKSLSPDHFANPVMSFRLGRTKKYNAAANPQSAMMSKMLEMHGTSWIMSVNHCLERIARLEREQLVDKMTSYKEDAPNTHYNSEDPDVDMLGTLATLLLEHASELGEGHFRYLYFGLQLKEWLYFSEIESYPADILMLANGHLNVWLKKGIRAEEHHLLRSRQLFERYISEIGEFGATTMTPEAPSLINSSSIRSLSIRRPRTIPDDDVSFLSQVKRHQSSDPFGKIPLNIWATYSRVLQYLGEHEQAAGTMEYILAHLDHNHPQYANFLFYTGAIYKAMKEYERANEYLFESIHSGPPTGFSKLEIMTLICRNLEQMFEANDTVDEEVEPYAAVYDHLFTNGDVLVDYDSWICDANTWFTLADKCSNHEMYSLATDLYGLGMMRDPSAFTKTLVWLRYAKASHHCHRLQDARLSTRQALTKDPENMQLSKAYADLTTENTAFKTLTEQLDLGMLLDVMPPVVDQTKLGISRLQAVVKGNSERKNFILGVDPRRSLAKRIVAKLGIVLAPDLPLLLRTPATWMGNVSFLDVVDVRDGNARKFRVLLRQTVAPMREAGPPRAYYLTLACQVLSAGEEDDNDVGSLRSGIPSAFSSSSSSSSSSGCQMEKSTQSIATHIIFTYTDKQTGDFCLYKTKLRFVVDKADGSFVGGSEYIVSSEESIALLTVFTSIRKSHVFKGVVNWREKLYHMRVVNESDVTLVSLLQASSNALVVFLMRREHFNRSYVMGIATRKLMEIVERDPVLSRIFSLDRSTTSMKDLKTLLQPLKVPAGDKSAGVLVALFNKRPVLGSRFEEVSIEPSPVPFSSVAKPKAEINKARSTSASGTITTTTTQKYRSHAVDHFLATGELLSAELPPAVSEDDNNAQSALVEAIVGKVIAPVSPLKTPAVQSALLHRATHRDSHSSSSFALVKASSSISFAPSALPSPEVTAEPNLNFSVASEGSVGSDMDDVSLMSEDDETVKIVDLEKFSVLQSFRRNISTLTDPSPKSSVGFQSTDSRRFSRDKVMDNLQHKYEERLKVKASLTINLAAKAAAMLVGSVLRVGTGQVCNVLGVMGEESRNHTLTTLQLAMPASKGSRSIFLANHGNCLVGCTGKIVCIGSIAFGEVEKALISSTIGQRKKHLAGKKHSMTDVHLAKKQGAHVWEIVLAQPLAKNHPVNTLVVLFTHVKHRRVSSHSISSFGFHLLSNGEGGDEEEEEEEAEEHVSLLSASGAESEKDEEERRSRFPSLEPLTLKVATKNEDGVDAYDDEVFETDTQADAQSKSPASSPQASVVAAEPAPEQAPEQNPALATALILSPSQMIIKDASVSESQNEQLSPSQMLRQRNSSIDEEEDDEEEEEEEESITDTPLPISEMTLAPALSEEKNTLRTVSSKRDYGYDMKKISHASDAKPFTSKKARAPPHHTWHDHSNSSVASQQAFHDEFQQVFQQSQQSQAETFQFESADELLSALRASGQLNSVNPATVFNPAHSHSHSHASRPQTSQATSVPGSSSRRDRPATATAASASATKGGGSSIVSFDPETQYSHQSVNQNLAEQSLLTMGEMSDFNYTTNHTPKNFNNNNNQQQQQMSSVDRSRAPPRATTAPTNACNQVGVRDRALVTQSASRRGSEKRAGDSSRSGTAGAATRVEHTNPKWRQQQPEPMKQLPPSQRRPDGLSSDLQIASRPRSPSPAGQGHEMDVMRRTIEQISSIGYIDEEKPIALSPYWEAKIVAYLRTIDKFNTIHKKLVNLQKLVPRDYSLAQKICALAATDGNIGTIKNKADDLDFMSEIIAVCKLIDVTRLLAIIVPGAIDYAQMYGLDVADITRAVARRETIASQLASQESVELTEGSQSMAKPLFAPIPASRLSVMEKSATKPHYNRMSFVSMTKGVKAPKGTTNVMAGEPVAPIAPIVEPLQHHGQHSSHNQKQQQPRLSSMSRMSIALTGSHTAEKEYDFMRKLKATQEEDEQERDEQTFGSSAVAPLLTPLSTPKRKRGAVISSNPLRLLMELKGRERRDESEPSPNSESFTLEADPAARHEGVYADFSEVAGEMPLEMYLVNLAANVEYNEVWVPHSAEFGRLRRGNTQRMSSIRREIADLNQRDRVQGGSPTGRARGEDKSAPFQTWGGEEVRWEKSHKSMHECPAVVESHWRPSQLIASDSATDGTSRPASGQSSPARQKSVRLTAQMDNLMEQSSDAPVALMRQKTKRTADFDANLLKSDRVHLRLAVKSKWNRAIGNALNQVSHRGPSTHMPGGTPPLRNPK